MFRPTIHYDGNPFVSWNYHICLLRVFFPSLGHCRVIFLIITLFLIWHDQQFDENGTCSTDRFVFFFHVSAILLLYMNVYMHMCMHIWWNGSCYIYWIEVSDSVMPIFEVTNKRCIHLKFMNLTLFCLYGCLEICLPTFCQHLSVAVVEGPYQLHLSMEKLWLPILFEWSAAWKLLLMLLVS